MPVYTGSRGLGFKKGRVETTYDNLIMLLTATISFSFEGSWIHSICFSADGNKLAWTGHDCSLSIADASNGAPAVVQTLRHQFLPLITTVWVGPNSVLSAGHDCCPILFTYKGPTGGISDGKQVLMLQIPQSFLPSLAFSPRRSVGILACRLTSRVNPQV